MKLCVLVRDDGVVQQHIQLEEPLPDLIGGMRVMPWDGDPTARLRLVDGELQEITEPPAVSDIEARAQRSALFAASDWTQVADSPLSSAARAAWATYRQALRDLPQQPGWPAAVVWPAQPQA